MKVPLDKMHSDAHARSIAHLMLKHSDGDAKLAFLLTVSVGRLLKKMENRERVWLDAFDRSTVRHIADWLRAAIANDDPWLANVDQKNRPKKLMKFSNIEQITQEADKAMRKANQSYTGIKLVEGDEELFAELEDGFYLVRLMTPTALDKESAEMQHCIGNGGYDRMVMSGTGYYLSLRDKHGKAHATLEVCQSHDYERHNKKMRVEQLQGKQNQPPLAKYAQYLWSFIERNSWKIEVISQEFGMVQDIRGKIHSIYDIPEGFISSGDIDSPISGPEINLPANMTINGSLNLNNAPISKLPQTLRVKDDLRIDNTEISELPSCLNVGGDIYAEGSNLQNIHMQKIQRDLYVHGCQNLVFETPIEIGGDLWIRSSGVTSLPEGMKISGIIYSDDNQLNLETWPSTLAPPGDKLAHELDAEYDEGSHEWRM